MAGRVVYEDDVQAIVKQTGGCVLCHPYMDTTAAILHVKGERKAFVVVSEDGTEIWSTNTVAFACLYLKNHGWVDVLMGWFKAIHDETPLRQYVDRFLAKNPQYAFLGK